MLVGSPELTGAHAVTLAGISSSSWPLCCAACLLQPVRCRSHHAAMPHKSPQLSAQGLVWLSRHHLPMRPSTALALAGVQDWQEWQSLSLCYSLDECCRVLLWGRGTTRIKSRLLSHMMSRT